MKEVTPTQTAQAKKYSRSFTVYDNEGVYLGRFTVADNIPETVQKELTPEVVANAVANAEFRNPKERDEHYNPFAK